MAAKATSSIQVLARVNRLLDTIAAHDEPISLKTLSSATGLHPSTAFRILASLIEHGFVERSESGYYRLGVKLLQLGNRVHGRLDMRREARPLMERLRDQTGETVNLCIREGDDVVYVERAVAPRLMRVEQVIGGRAPLHVTAAGKLFLAESGTAACREYAIRTGLPPRTAQSISDPEALCQALEAIRIAGYALDEQEAETVLQHYAEGSYPNTEIVGMMGMASNVANQQQIENEFSGLWKFFEKAKVKYPFLTTLSMGMSGDYLTAIQHGSTMVRIGSAVFKSQSE